MKSFVGQVSQASGTLRPHPLVVVTNEGTATVYYEWKKVNRKDYIESKHSDCTQRFYCHYVPSLP